MFCVTHDLLVLTRGKAESIPAAGGCASRSQRPGLRSEVTVGCGFPWRFPFGPFAFDAQPRTVPFEICL